MRQRFIALAVLATVALTGGCGLVESTVNGGATSGEPATTSSVSPTPTAETASPAPTGDASSGLGPAKDSGDLPDPCTLLTGAQVVNLTSRQVTQIDEDDAGPGAVTRFCQWQQSGGQLAVFLTRTTATDFEVTVADAEPVAKIGENAYRHSGRLYVLYGTVQIEVYSRGGSEAQNLADATKVARTIIPGL